MRYTPGLRGIVVSRLASLMAFVERDACAGELYNLMVLA